MAGTPKGGAAAAQTNKQKYGADFYAKIGSEGGRKGRTGGFASDKVGEDGLTGRERARVMGARGGKISRRGKNNKDIDILLHDTKDPMFDDEFVWRI